MQSQEKNDLRIKYKISNEIRSPFKSSVREKCSTNKSYKKLLINILYLTNYHSQITNPYT